MARTAIRPPETVVVHGLEIVVVHGLEIVVVHGLEIVVALGQTSSAISGSAR